MSVATRILITTISLHFKTQIGTKMSSFKTNFTIVKILCIVYFISLMGSKSAVNGGVVISGSALSPNRPPNLLTSSLSINNALSSGQISPAEAHKQGQYLIQANKDQVNLALIHGIGKK